MPLPSFHQTRATRKLFESELGRCFDGAFCNDLSVSFIKRIQRFIY